MVGSVLHAGSEASDVLQSVEIGQGFLNRVLPYCSQEVLQTARSHIAGKYKGRYSHECIQSCEREIDAALAAQARK